MKAPADLLVVFYIYQYFKDHMKFYIYFNLFDHLTELKFLKHQYLFFAFFFNISYKNWLAWGF